MKRNRISVILSLATMCFLPLALAGNTQQASGLANGETTKQTQAVPATGNEFTPPKIKQAYVVIYPIEMFEQRIEGKVLLDVVLDKSGAVSDVLVRDTTDARFNTNAMAAARKFTFSAGKKNGNPVIVHMPLLITFALDDAVIDGHCATTRPNLIHEVKHSAADNNLEINARDEIKIEFDYVIGKNGHIIFLNLDKCQKNEMVESFFGHFMKNLYSPATFDGRPVAVFFHAKVDLSGRINWIL
jgi:TonB family protein